MGHLLSAGYADLYDEFLDAQQTKISPQGFVTLKDISRRVLTWFDTQELDMHAVTIQDALQFALWASERVTKEGNSIATGTMRNYLNVARRFFDHLVRTERIASNPFREVKYPRLPEHFSKNVLSESQMGCLLKKLEQFDELPLWSKRIRRYRVHVIAEFLYATGFRIAEACSLTASNLDLDQRLVYVAEGKGGKARTVFLGSYAAAVMKLYLEKGRALVFGNYARREDHDGNLFGADRTRVGFVVNTELETVCAELGIPVITSHGFRHSLGTHLLRSGCDMRHIQVILGHESLGTTQIYTRVDKEDLKRSLDEFHPRKWNDRSGHDQ